MKKALLVAVAIVIIVASLFISLSNVTAINGEFDRFEHFGPRADKLLFKLYSSPYEALDAMLGCDVDIADSLLPPDYDIPPETPIDLAPYIDGTLDECVLEINHNSTLYGSPNPCAVRSFRQALAHLINRTHIINDIFMGDAYPMYTEIPYVEACPALSEYMHPEIQPGGFLEHLTYPFDIDEAINLLMLDGFFQMPDGYWYWVPEDIDPDRWPGYSDLIRVHLIFVARWDEPGKYEASVEIVSLLDSLGIETEMWEVDDIDYFDTVLQDKYFNLYLGDRNLRCDPDYLYDLKHSQMYWHPGICPNYIHFSDSLYDFWAEKLKCAASHAEAMEAALYCQEIFADMVGSIPICNLAGVKAYKTEYSGTPGVVDEEDVWEGLPWRNLVNGYWDKCSCGGDIGVNSWWSFLNMHPEGYETGDCSHMTIRYGLSDILKMLNPVYSPAFCDWEVMNKVYDTLIKSNPLNASEFLPWLALNWTVGEWTHPDPSSGYGTGTKLALTLRTNVRWHDGALFSSEDVKFTLYELPKLLEEHGFPKPWWHMKVKQIMYVHTPDPCNVQVYFTNKTIWALNWIGKLKILPRHVWMPIMEEASDTFWSMGDVNRDGYINETDAEIIEDNFGWTGPPGGNPADINSDGVVDIFDATECGLNYGLDAWTWYGPEAFMPDVDLIGCGPWRFIYYDYPTVLLEKNTDYFHWCPVDVAIKVSLPLETEWKQIVPGWPTPEQWDEFWSMGDVNRDGYINETDMEIIEDNFGWTGPPGGNPADINSDGRVDAQDVLICAFNIGKVIWEVFYTSYPVVFDIKLHNVWANYPYGSTVITRKIVYLHVPAPPIQGEEIGELPQANFFDGQWIHFIMPTKLYFPLGATIHYQTEGPVMVNGIEEYHYPCETVVYPLGTEILFFECTQIDLPEGALMEFKNSTILSIVEDWIPLDYCEEHWEAIPIRIKRCHWRIQVSVHIEDPFPWICQWINRTFDFWATLPEDISGKDYFPPQSEHRAPDCTVDMRDIGTAARAFGSYPLHPRWTPIADINHDYQIDMRDIGTIARKFGWGGPLGTLILGPEDF